MNTPKRSGVSTIPIWVVSVPAILLVGAMTALVPKGAAAMIVGVAFVSVAFITPPTALLVWTLVFAALIGGSIEYFFGLAQANWIPFVLSLVLLTRSTFAPKGVQFAQKRDLGQSGNYFLAPAFVFLVTLMASSLLNLTPLPQILASVKNYLLMWGVLFALLLAPKLGDAKRLVWKWVLIIAALQLPVVLYQKLFISSKIANSAGSLSYDAINGTFGGGLLGGRSGALAMFVCIAIGYAMILWREGRWSGPRLLGYLLATLPTLAIVEVKAVVFWLPVVTSLVFVSQIKQRPAIFVLTMACSLALVFGIMVVYQTNYGAPTAGGSVVEEFFRKIYYVFDPERFNSTTRELGRFSALTHWWRENSLSNPIQFLLGHGPGASRGASSFAVGTVAAKYSFFIDISAAAALLWDTGLVGTLAFLGTLGFGMIQTAQASRGAKVDQENRIYFQTASIALLLILSSVFYTRDAVDGPIVQFMIFFCLGHTFGAFGSGKAAATRRI